MNTNERVTQVVRRDDGLTARQVAKHRLRVTIPKQAPIDGELAIPICRIGALPNNDIVIAHPSVSGLHCEVSAQHNGLLVRDLGSTNGTVLGTVRVEEAYWTTGTLLQLGDVTVELMPASGVSVLPAEASFKLGTLVGQSPVMRELFTQIRGLANSDATLLLGGETGTGKEAFVETIVALSARANKPLVVVDCGALSPTLIESQLFGHEKGAFTGATQTQAGAFERAHLGTVFLDEIGELPSELQPKLLRVLERREVLRVGGRSPLPVDVRIVAATHRSLDKEVNAGRFRADLFYRLSVLRLTVPPLRDRLEDIPLLVQHFLGDTPMPNETMLAQWASHHWPGNVRELRNAIERWKHGQPWHSAQQPARPRASAVVPEPSLELPFLTQKDALIEQFESRYAAVLLASAGHNISAAARLSGLSRMAVVKMLQRLNLYSSLGES
jgi:transcriptional regulator with PAS, ATPase and Fis domain